MNLKKQFLCTSGDKIFILFTLFAFFTLCASFVRECSRESHSEIAECTPQNTPTAPQANHKDQVDPKLSISHSKILISSHRSLFLTLKQAGFSNNDILLAMKVIPKKSVRVGQKIRIAHRGTELVSLRLPLSFSIELEVVKTSKGDFVCRKKIAPIQKVYTRIESQVGTNMFSSLTKKRVPYSIAVALVRSLAKMGRSWRSSVTKNTKVTLLYKQLKNPYTSEVIFDQLCLVQLKTGKSQSVYYAYKVPGDSGIKFYTHSGNCVSGEENFCRPLRGGHLSSHFGIRYHPIHHVRKMHAGVDFSAPSGTPIFATASGVIEKMGPKSGYGHYIKIRHGNGFYSAYGHMKGYARGIRVGKYIEQGRVIGYVGATGTATAPHLHFEIRCGSHPINPLKKVAHKTHLIGKKKRDFQCYVRSLWQVCGPLSN